MAKVKKAVKKLGAVKSEVKPEKVEKKKKLYKVSIECAGESFVSESNDILEVLKQFAPPIIKGEVVVRIESGKKTLERLFPTMRARLLFQNKTAVELLARDLGRFLQDDRDNLIK